VAQIVVLPPAFADLERIRDFYAGEPARARAHITAIREAILILARHPLIGRIVEDDLRELVISRGKDGFLALYRYVAQPEHVRILRVRHQRELGYPKR
jgi:plasmid stabilization system protein ParE